MNVGFLTSGRVLARNIVFNIIGGVLPAIAALIAVPVLVRGLGDAKFGILALAWTTIGYFSLFDLGIGRALTHAVADRIGNESHDEIGSTVWTSVGIILPIGFVGAILLLVAAPWLVDRVLGVPRELQHDAIVAFRILAIAIPFTGIAAAFRGLLEATQRFGIVNALRVPFGLLTFLGPVAALPFSRSLTVAIAILTIGRAILCLAYVVACQRAIPQLAGGRFQAGLVRTLLSYGGWMTVSNVVSPIMATFDRFLIGAVLGVAVVTHYAAPYELATKMWLYTAATLPVFFPAFAATASRDSARTVVLLDRMLRITLAGLALPTLALAVLAPEVMRLWLGASATPESASVLRILALAVFVNSLGQAAYTFVQAMARPDITGKLHLAELPLYALLLWMLLPRYGIVGAALAWGVRVGVDTILLLIASVHLVPDSRDRVWRTSLWFAAVATITLAAAVPQATSARLALALAASIIWMVTAWRYLLTDAEKLSPARIFSAVSPTTSG